MSRMGVPQHKFSKKILLLPKTPSKLSFFSPTSGRIGNGKIGKDVEKISVFNLLQFLF